MTTPLRGLAGERRIGGGGAPRRAPARAQRRPAGCGHAAEVGWHHQRQYGICESYYFSPEDITTDSFNQMWSLRSDHVVHVLAHAHSAAATVTVSALVRTTDPSRPISRRRCSSTRCPATSTRPRCGPRRPAPRPQLPSRVLDRAEDLQIPIGPTGILVGARTRGHLTARPKIQRDDW